MTRESDDSARNPRPDRRFATTRWSVVMMAAGRGGSPAAEQAFAQLCETYWYPLYAYVRRQGYDQAASQDLTQGFFARLLEKRDFAGVDPERGRFRSFLLASMKHYLLNEWDKARAAKRGGGRRPLSLDFGAGEDRFRLEASDQRTPEDHFDRHWALTLLERVQDEIRRRYTSAGQEPLFEHLKTHLSGDATAITYPQVADDLGMSEAAVKAAAHRLRQRFRKVLRREIALTVADDREIDQEIHDLFEALRR